MTPKPIEDAFSEALFQEAEEPKTWDLSLEGPLFHRQHPKVLLATLLHERAPQELPLPETFMAGWHLECFETMEEAESECGTVEVKFRGSPWEIGLFLKSGVQTALIDFSPLGAVHLSKEKSLKAPRRKLCEHTLPLFLNYALSPELWGPAGKWPRFHRELTTVLSQKNLLIKGETPGYYLLKENASALEKNGFKGTHVDKSYLLVLPWTFSLAGLKRLVEFVRQEF